MKKIKFRGKRLDNGELIYGDLLHHGKFGFCIREYVIDGFSTLQVDPKSVVQFVGYDADGNEIYERDMLKDNYGKVFTAEMAVSLENEHNYTEACDVGDTIFGYRRWSLNEEN